MIIGKRKYDIISKSKPYYVKIFNGVYKGTILKVEDELEIIQHHTPFSSYYEIINSTLDGKTDCGKTIALKNRTSIEWLQNYNGPTKYVYNKPEKIKSIPNDLFGNMPKIGDCIVHMTTPSYKLKKQSKASVSKLLTISNVVKISPTGHVYVKPIVYDQTLVENKLFRIDKQFVIINENFKDLVLVKKLMLNA